MLLAFAALLCAAMLAPAVASAAATGSIEGTVTGADTQEGIEGVEACAWAVSLEEPGEEEEFWYDCVFTGPDGTYAIEEVPAGEYEVEFWAEGTGYVSEYYPDLVVVGAGATTGIDAELDPAATIKGTVTRSSDEKPVEEVEVCAWGIENEEFGGCTWTEPDGTYALETEAGEWGIEFWPVWTGQNLTYQYFDHRDRWSEADAVSVGEGETVEEIDAELDPGATIFGHVFSAATGAGLEEIHVCAIDATTDELTICTRTFEEGEYELPFLPAGQYKVVFSIDFEEWFEEEFGEEEDDGFPTQFWNNQTTLAAANVIPLGVGQAVSGIDARLGTAPPVGPATVTTNLQVEAPPAVTPPIKKISKHKHCPKGKKLKKVKGKYRCVKRKKHRRHRGSARVSSAPAGSLGLRPGSTPVSRPPVRIAR